jgi:hypothetical protein
MKTRNFKHDNTYAVPRHLCLSVTVLLSETAATTRSLREIRRAR